MLLGTAFKIISYIFSVTMFLVMKQAITASFPQYTTS